MLMAAGYSAMVLASTAGALAGAMLFAVATIGMLGSWFHDGVHRTRRSPVIIALMYLGAAPVAFSPRWWDIKHLRLHHRYPGNPVFDPDIQFGYAARVTPLQPWKRHHRTQHLHMWLLYPLATLNILKPEEARKAHRYARLLGWARQPSRTLLLLDKYLPFAVVWLPVFGLLPAGQAWSRFLAFHFVAGTLASLVTQIQHNTALTLDADAGSPAPPLCEQLMRTSDVGGRGVWWWLCGGVNFHVAHHLAPTLPVWELPAVTKRLRAELRGCGLEVPTHKGLWAAICSHARLLRLLSRPPLDLTVTIGAGDR
jgi:linoleoyl-CoA desaturase